MEGKIKRGKNIINIVVRMLIISLSFYITRCGLCSDEPIRDTERTSKLENFLPPMDDYAEVEAKILEMSKELSYKNKLSAKKTEGIVRNPGIIVGKVKVVNTHSKRSKRYSEDTIVYLENVDGYTYQPVTKKHAIKTGHFAFTKEKGIPAEPPIVDQWNVEFIPHVLPILKGSTVDFPNTDKVRHNVYSPVPIPGTRRMLSLGTYDPGVIKTIRLDNPGEIELRCNVHKEMSAFIVVLNNPYFTLTDKKGEFAINNVPPGKYTLKTWHEKFKPVSIEITVEPNETLEVELPSISERREPR